MPLPNKIAPGIDRKPGGKYRVRVTFERRTITLGQFGTLSAAKSARTIALGQIASGQFVPPSVRKEQQEEAEKIAAAEQEAAAYTVDDLAAAWIAWQEHRGLAHNTVYSRRKRYAHDVKPTFGTTPVQEVTPEAVAAWHKDVAVRAPGTAYEVLVDLRAMFKFGMGRVANLPAGFTPVMLSNPAEIATPKYVKAKRPDVTATPAEVAALASGMPEGEALAVLLAAWAGLRIGEVLGLRRGDFWTAPALRDGETAHGFVKVQRQVQSRGSGGVYETAPKSAAGFRDVPVPAVLAETIADHLRDHAGLGEAGLVFPREIRGTQFKAPNTFRNHYVTARDGLLAELPEERAKLLAGFRFHDLRGTALTAAGQAGATLAELMRLGGHSTPETVLIYQRATLDRLAGLSDVMNSTVVVPGAPAPVVDLAAARARRATA